MNDVLEPLAGGALGVWIALSALAQIPLSPTLRRLLRFDVLRLVGPYHLFAPNPRLEDTRVLSRPIALDGPSFEWQPVWNYRPRTLLRALWNPRRAADSAFARDSWSVAAACRRGVPAEDLESSFGFQHVRNVARYHALGSDGAGLFEFRLVIVRFGTGEPDTEDVVLHSGPHGTSQHGPT